MLKSRKSSADFFCARRDRATAAATRAHPLLVPRLTCPRRVASPGLPPVQDEPPHPIPSLAVAVAVHPADERAPVEAGHQRGGPINTCGINVGKQLYSRQKKKRVLQKLILLRLAPFKLQRCYDAKVVFSHIKNIPPQEKNIANLPSSQTCHRYFGA